MPTVVHAHMSHHQPWPAAADASTEQTVFALAAVHTITHAPLLVDAEQAVVHVMVLRRYWSAC